MHQTVLPPSAFNVTIKQCGKFLSLRNRMISAIFVSTWRCICGQFEDMEHIYTYKTLNKKEQTISNNCFIRLVKLFWYKRGNEDWNIGV